jgi:hypothetical protein
MIGKNPLWVAKQHGHSVQTMLETYAAWLEETTEADLRVIQKAIEAPATSALAASATKVARPLSLSLPPGSQKAVSSLSTDDGDETEVPDFWWMPFRARGLHRIPTE